MSGFKRRPANPEDVEAFLSDAPTSTTRKEAPLEDEETAIKAADDSRLARSINLRLTERELRQLQYISKYAGVSINSFVRMTIQSRLEQAMAVARRRKEERLV